MPPIMNAMSSNFGRMMPPPMNAMSSNFGRMMQSEMNAMSSNSGTMNPNSNFRKFNPNVANIGPVHPVSPSHLENKLKSAEEKISLLESKLEKYHDAFTKQTNKCALMREDIGKLVSNANDTQHITTELKQDQILNARYGKLKDDHTFALSHITTLTNQNDRLEKVFKQLNQLDEMDIFFKQKRFSDKNATVISDDFEFINSDSFEEDIVQKK
uniref:TACC_C domain-containing protein n=1 Tax=Rhabditophanes sp. KR3021 TaxID=114890 RepID=A0AC35UGA3_9BILA